MVRYADDFVIGLQYKIDGYRLRQALTKRLVKFSLSLNESKTHLIEFGRFAALNRRQRKQSKPKTFDFLGFTHICSVRRIDGQFKLLRLSIKKRLTAKLRHIKEVLMKTRQQVTIRCWSVAQARINRILQLLCRAWKCPKHSNNEN